jgi:hypothetical protein
VMHRMSEVMETPVREGAAGRTSAEDPGKPRKMNGGVSIRGTRVDEHMGAEIWCLLLHASCPATIACLARVSAAMLMKYWAKRDV